MEMIVVAAAVITRIMIIARILTVSTKMNKSGSISQCKASYCFVVEDSLRATAGHFPGLQGCVE